MLYMQLVAIVIICKKAIRLAGSRLAVAKSMVTEHVTFKDRSPLPFSSMPPFIHAQNRISPRSV